MIVQPHKSAMAPPAHLDLLAILSNLFISGTLGTRLKKLERQQRFHFFIMLLTHGHTFFPADRFFFHPPRQAVMRVVL